VEWDKVVAVEDRLPIEELLAEVPGHRWDAVFSSGQVAGLRSRHRRRRCPCPPTNEMRPSCSTGLSPNAKADARFKLT
jgi:hypothetical protein